jgi:hypothetical protein
MREVSQVDLFLLRLVQITFALLFVCPVGVLILVKRSTGNWQQAVRWCIATATAVAFSIGGVAEAVFIWFRSQQRIREPDGLSDETIVRIYFLLGGVAGMIVAASGTVVNLALLALWRLASPTSFRHVLRYPVETSSEVL